MKLASHNKYRTVVDAVACAFAFAFAETNTNFTCFFLFRSCKQSLKMTVCQPHRSTNKQTMRKSSLLTAAKKAKLKSNPSRVRFADGVTVNGNSASNYSSFDSCVPFMPNVLKVFLENGQTKTFKYDSNTCVQVCTFTFLLNELHISDCRVCRCCVVNLCDFSHLLNFLSTQSTLSFLLS